MPNENFVIKAAWDSDLENVLRVESSAFGTKVESELVEKLLKDPTAAPLISLLAHQNDMAIGHILMTSAGLDSVKPLVSAMILGPLAVIPDKQKMGVGIALVRAAIDEAALRGIDLIFVLGHPNYYPRFGFAPAGRRGFDAPYPIPPKNAPAWMVKELRPGLIGQVRGTVKCAESLDKPEFWRE